MDHPSSGNHSSHCGQCRVVQASLQQIEAVSLDNVYVLVFDVDFIFRGQPAYDPDNQPTEATNVLLTSLKTK